LRRHLGATAGSVRLACGSGHEARSRLASALVPPDLRRWHDLHDRPVERSTAVVLTRAVAAAVQNAKVKNPLPYLFICVLIANAVSFVLPISNLANRVIYSAKMPPLLEWLPRFAMPSVLSILAT
jgi:hypothetical protein